MFIIEQSRRTGAALDLAAESTLCDVLLPWTVFFFGASVNINGKLFEDGCAGFEFQLHVCVRLPLGDWLFLLCQWNEGLCGWAESSG